MAVELEMTRINSEQAKGNKRIVYHLLGNGPDKKITEAQIERVLQAELDIQISRSAKPLCIIGRVYADEKFLRQALELDSESGLLLASNFFYGQAKNLINEAYQNTQESSILRTIAAACLETCRFLSDKRFQKYPPPKFEPSYPAKLAA